MKRKLSDILSWIAAYLIVVLVGGVILIVPFTVIAMCVKLLITLFGG